MLILNRFDGEKLTIGDDIEIVVLSTSTGQVRLGITAPKEVPVMRTEAKMRQPKTTRAE